MLLLFFSPKNVIDAIELTTSIWLCYCGISLRIFKQSYSEESFFLYVERAKNKMKRFFDAGVSINSYSIAYSRSRNLHFKCEILTPNRYSQ